MKTFFHYLCYTALLSFIVLFWHYKPWTKPSWFGVHKVESNYGKEVEKICSTLKVSPDYFKALIILETSANKPVKSRFERKVYNKLVAVRDRKLGAYSNLSFKDLKNKSNKDLRAYATSWGPLQIMGYHSIRLKQNVSYFYGDDALKNGIQWCMDNYGKYLSDQDFKNAFHLHNTGKLYPKIGYSKTHDPNYVKNGLAYIDMMKNNENTLVASFFSY